MMRGWNMTEREMTELAADATARSADFLWAAILLEGEYPELAQAMDEMAQREAKRFRLLCGMMQRLGMDPALRRLLRRNADASTSLLGNRREQIDLFLRRMTEGGARTWERSERVLRSSELSRDENSSELLATTAEELGLLRRITES